jgi:hypothetical protein
MDLENHTPFAALAYDVATLSAEQLRWIRRFD